jgi:hypothetical protein
MPLVSQRHNSKWCKESLCDHEGVGEIGSTPWPSASAIRLYRGRLGFHFPDCFKLALRSIVKAVGSSNRCSALLSQAFDIPGTNGPLEVGLRQYFLLVGIDMTL